jgi:hypothetical protein
MQVIIFMTPAMATRALAVLVEVLAQFVQETAGRFFDSMPLFQQAMHKA